MFFTDTTMEQKNKLCDRKRIPVRIRGIEDWCIDYTYANPTLWLIAESGVWYRVAGPLCVGYMHNNLQMNSDITSASTSYAESGSEEQQQQQQQQQHIHSLTNTQSLTQSQSLSHSHTDSHIQHTLHTNAYKGHPSTRYQTIYEKTLKQFLSSVHVAMCLIDFLPSSSKLSLQFLCEEVAARSEGEIDEVDILENYRFIAGK